MPADWQAIENGLQAFIARASGLPGNTVIWEIQNGSRPTGTFATLRIDGDTTSGLYAEQTERDNPTSTPGHEILIETREDAEFTFTVQVFSPNAAGNSSARAILTRVRNALSKESELNNFDSLGLAFIDKSPIQSVPVLIETQYQGHATLDTRFRVADGTEDTTTFIETVEFEDSFD